MAYLAITGKHLNMPMRYQELIEIAIPRFDAGTLQQAAYDFLNDWLQIDPDSENREPSPRRDIIKALRQQGFDPDTSPSDKLQAALIPVMQAEAQRFLQSLPWRNGKLTVYRNIQVPLGWERDPTTSGDLGVFWAITDQWGGNTTIVSQVRSNQIDWDIVILKHLTYSENEIRIKDNQKIPILRVYRQQDGHAVEQDVHHLAGKLFSVGERSEEWPD
jgi:hypothetical protein